MDSLTKNLALKRLHVLKARIARREAEYQREVEQAHKEGFRPHYCPHGTNLWVDWDPICGYCEDGEPNVYDMAITWAKAAIYKSNQRRAYWEASVTKAAHDGDRMPSSVTEPFIDWILAPLDVDA
jgi:hypothetical protein